MNLRKGVAVLVLILSSKAGIAQYDTHRLFIGLGAEGGIGTQGQFGAGKSILKPDFVGNLGGFLMINALFYNRIGIELGVGQNYQYQHLKDKRFYETHQSKFDVDFYVQNYFPSIEGSLYLNIPLPKSYVDLYIKGGFRRSFIGAGQTSQQTTFSPDNTQMNTTSSYGSINQQLIGEAGVRFKLDGNHIIATGLKYNYGLDKMVDMDYQVSSNSQPAYEDTYQTNGSFVGVFLGFYFHTFSWKFPKIEIKASEPVVKNTPKPNKKVEFLNKLTVNQAVVKIEIFDPNKEDGDIISVAFNNRWILRNLTVSHRPHSQELTLQKGRNVILFQAENLGTISPNTAVMYVITNSRTYKVAFKTTLDKSQAIEIFYP